MESSTPPQGGHVAYGAVNSAGDRLHGLIEALGVPFGRERSIKLREGALLANRFLLTVGRESLGAEAERRLISLCAELHMPAQVVDLVTRRLAEANIIHFGFEEERAGRHFYKVYLEGSTKRGGPFVLHEAIKWNPDSGAEHVIAKYVCHPGLTNGQMLQKISAIYASQSERTPWHLTCDLVSAASRRAGDEHIMYLDVSEEGTGRRSFDVNLYPAGFAVDRLAPFADRLAAHYRIPPADLHDAIRRVAIQRLGHISGGVDRQGRDFFTFYFGVEGLR